MPGFEDMYSWDQGDPGDGYYAAEREAVNKRKNKLREYGKPFLDGLRTNFAQATGQGLTQNPYAQQAPGGGMQQRPDPWAQAISTGYDLFQNRGK